MKMKFLHLCQSLSFFCNFLYAFGYQHLVKLCLTLSLLWTERKKKHVNSIIQCKRRMIDNIIKWYIWLKMPGSWRTNAIYKTGKTINLPDSFHHITSTINFNYLARLTFWKIADLFFFVNSSWPTDTIWRAEFCSSLNHNLNKFWLRIMKSSSEGLNKCGHLCICKICCTTFSFISGNCGKQNG